MRKSRIAILFVLLGLSFCQPIRADEAPKRYWIDELAGPVGDLKGKGVELRQKVRELKVVQEEGLGGRDGRMTRWIRVYETQFPWMLLASTEEKWERKSKRAAVRSYGECIRSPFILAPMLQREFGKCAIPFEMPFESAQLESITSFLSRINEIPSCSETDSARCRYHEGMPCPFTLVSAPNDYNKLDVICDLRPWFSEGRGKGRYQDFQCALHDEVASRLTAYKKDSPLRRIRVPLSKKWEHFLGNDIARMRKEFGECKLLFTCTYDVREPGRTNMNVTCRTYSINSGKVWFHTRQCHDDAESVYKVQVERDFYKKNLTGQETDEMFNPARTWGNDLSNSGVHVLSSNVCVMVTKDPWMFHWADDARINLETEKTKAYHSISWAAPMPSWFPTTFSTNIADMCQLYYLESLPQEMFRVPHACYEMGVKGGGENASVGDIERGR